MNSMDAKLVITIASAALSAAGTIVKSIADNKK